MFFMVKRGLFSRKKATVTPGFAYWSGGSTSVLVNSSDKYNFGTDAVTSGTNLPLARDKMATGGNTEMGIFAGGSSVFNTTGNHQKSWQRLLFSNETFTNGTTLTYAMERFAGTSTSTSAYFGGGLAGTLTQKVVQIWNFGNSTCAAGTALSTSTGRHYHAAAGNANLGFFMAGNTGSQAVRTSDRYNYATNTTQSGSFLKTNGREALAGAGNKDVGLFAGGSTYGTAVDVLTYADLTVVTGTSLGASRQYLSGAAHATVGYFGAGWNGTVGNYVDKYTFATNVRVQGTNLLSHRSNTGALSSIPGHF